MTASPFDAGSGAAGGAGGGGPRDGDGDDDLDDGRLTAMRSVWLSMRDEEPAPGGMDALLAAARAKATAMQPQPSWWQRVMTTVRRPPVLAFASVVLLAGGAVLVTHQLPDPLESTTATAPAEPADSAARTAGHATADPGSRRGIRPGSTSRPAIVRPRPVPAPIQKVHAIKAELAKLERRTGAV
ncbi:MAG: hypothetical protein M3680_17035, partial [Myxococcota bacterium]|nr:hypothetical protein [Myxococcota bacterium]